MNRYVIYSALVGNYDEILQPEVVDERFDYVLFSNDISSEKVGVWQIRPIEYVNRDNTRVCRYVKTHPEELLPEYQVSVWMDSNVRILSSNVYERIMELDEHDIPIASMWHPCRNCIYEEAFAVVNMMVEHEKVVVKWCHHLRREGYPKGNGLFETNVTFRKHYLPLVKRVDSFWWLCIESYSRRDQLSFNYVLWKLNVPIVYFWGEGYNARNTDSFNLVLHQDLKHNHCPLGKNEAWLMRHCWKHEEETDLVANLYYRFYSWPFPHFWIALMGQYYRVLDRLQWRKYLSL